MTGKRIRNILGLLVIIGAFVYLIFSGFKSSFQYFITPSDLLKSESSYVNKVVKLSGVVKKGSIIVNGLEHQFVLTDGTSDVSVYYKGVVPNTFREESEVVVGGKFNLSKSLFEASELIAKCASKYQSQ